MHASRWVHLRHYVHVMFWLFFLVKRIMPQGARPCVRKLLAAGCPRCLVLVLMMLAYMNNVATFLKPWFVSVGFRLRANLCWWEQLLTDSWHQLRLHVLEILMGARFSLGSEPLLQLWRRHTKGTFKWLAIFPVLFLFFLNMFMFVDTLDCCGTGYRLQCCRPWHKPGPVLWYHNSFWLFASCWQVFCVDVGKWHQARYRITHGLRLQFF